MLENNKVSKAGDSEDPHKGGAAPKPCHGPKGSIATFVRPRDGVRIYVFARNGEAESAAIQRVKSRNGAGGVEHQLVK